MNEFSKMLQKSITKDYKLQIIIALNVYQTKNKKHIQLARHFQNANKKKNKTPAEENKSLILQQANV